MDTGSGSDLGDGTGSEARTGSGSNDGAGSGTEMGSGSESSPRDGTGSETGTGIRSGSGSGSETGTEMDAGTGSSLGDGTGPEARAGSGSGSDDGAGSGTEMGSDPGSGPRDGTRSETGTRTGSPARTAQFSHPTDWPAPPSRRAAERYQQQRRIGQRQLIMTEGQRRELSMETQADAGRGFWRGVLTTGGFTAIPRWTLAPRAGVGELEMPIPNDLAAAIRRLAEDLVIPTSTVLLAAHVTVLSALSGETDVVTGYVPGPGAQPVPCPLSRGNGSWRRLLQQTHQSESELLAHRDFPIGALAYELGVAIPPFETVVDPNVVCGEFDEGTVLRVEMSSRGDRPVLRVRYRMDAVDTGFAGRVAGYHVRALELMTADPDAEHDRQSLLSAEELDHQLEGLQGPSRSLPDLRFHELFERRAGPTRTPSPASRATANGPTANSMPEPTCWAGPCWLTGWAARMSSRW